MLAAANNEQSTAGEPRPRKKIRIRRGRTGTIRAEKVSKNETKQRRIEKKKKEGVLEKAIRAKECKKKNERKRVETKQERIITMNTKQIKLSSPEAKIKLRSKTIS